MQKIACIVAIPLFLFGCASTVDLAAIRNEKCNAPAAYSNAVESLTTAAPAPLRNVASLAATLSSASLPPPITKANIVGGSALLNTPGARINIPELASGPAGLQATSLIPSSTHRLINSQAEVSDEQLQHAQEARNQIRELLSGVPLAASNFNSGNDNLVAHLGNVGKSSAGDISKINRTLQSGGYESLATASVDQLNNASNLSLSSVQKSYLTQEFHTARFLATYYWAYFRGGHVLQVSVDTKSLLDAGAQDVQSKVDKALSDAISVKNLTNEQKTAVSNVLGQLKTDVGKDLTDVSANICKADPTSNSGVCLLTQPLGSISFVSRAGTSIQFAGETVTIGSNGKFAPKTTKISMSVVGPQLTQVLWEAVFDSVPPFVPATSNSTACVHKLYDVNLCLDKATAKTILDEIDTVDADATTAETATATAAGYLIRGGWLFSLNNEAIAQVVETSAGEIARKTTEKLVWTQVNSACANQPIHPTVNTLKSL